MYTLFTRTIQSRFVLLFLAFIAYVIGFIVIEDLYGKGGPTAAVLLVVAAGLLYGLVPGLCAAPIAFVFNWLMYLFLGMEGTSKLLGGGGVAGTLSLMLIGAILGRIRDLSRRLSVELSERERTEKELRESKEQLENLIATSLDPIVITDASAAVLKPNRAFLDMIGYQESEIVGKALYSFSVTREGTYESTTGEQVYIGPDFFTKEIPEKMRLLKQSGEISDWETYFLHKNGKAIPVTQNIVWPYDFRGDHVSAFAIIRNITEQRKAEMELVASREAAIEANTFRTRFFTNITHEFRTPLTLAIGPMEGILRGEFGTIKQDVHQQISIALRNSRQLLRLVNQLLDFSMLESGGKNLFKETRDLVQFIKAMLESFSVVAQQKNILIDLQQEKSVPPVSIDPGKMEKVLVNLIGNAFKYTPPGGVIRLNIGMASLLPASPDETLIAGTAHPYEPPESGGGYIRISVADTGVGIKKEYHKKIFERFQQTGEQFAHEKGGSGIGLAYCKELVSLMGGCISVASSPGRGSVFSVYLPVDSPPAGETPVPESLGGDTALHFDPQVELSDISLGPEQTFESESISGEKPLVLVVDDNFDVRRYVAGILAKEFDYCCAGNGREALHTLKTHVPDIIVCDIMMPEMDGYQLLKRVRAHNDWKRISFIFLTAKADPAMKIEGLEEGADDYIVKPFNSLELLARVKALLRMRKLVQETSLQKKTIVNLSRKLENRYSFGNIVGNSLPMRKIYQIIESIKDSDANVLISGETGTGKELVAQATHYSSKRKRGPFISVNCGAIPKELMEREFFGHVRGAYTGAVKDAKGFFQEADGGTLFLDEIGEMEKDMQVKLLRVLERREFTQVGSSQDIHVNVRIIVATNKTLSEEVLSGNFREDLYFRVNVIPVHLPPLRQRREDIPLLIEHFLALYKKKHKTSPHQLSDEDMKFFLNYPYPGNVRELQHMLERFWLMGGSAEKNMLSPGISLHGDEAGHLETDGFALRENESLKEARARIEKDILVKTLQECNQNHSKAAERLKISRTALYKKINKLGLHT